MKAGTTPHGGLGKGGRQIGFIYGPLSTWSPFVVLKMVVHDALKVVASSGAATSTLAAHIK